MAGKSPEGQVIVKSSHLRVGSPSLDLVPIPSSISLSYAGVDIIEDVPPKERRVVELNTQAGVYILGKILSHPQSGSYSSSGPPPW